VTVRIVFMGTPDFAVPTFVELASRGHEIVAAYTRAPAAAGRGMGERRSPVHETAARFGIPVFHPASLKGDEAAEIFRAHEAEVAVVVAYGLLLPKAILEAPRYGCLNLHASLLPRWRGAAPIARAIMAGDKETGAMVMQMDQGLDTGPVALSERVAIGADTTAGELHDQIKVVGADLVARAVSALERGTLKFDPQPAVGVTYAKKIEKAETHIDWSQPWSEVHNHIRGLSPFPGAWFEMNVEGKPVRLKVIRSTRGEGRGTPGIVLDGALTIACGEGAVRLIEVQRAGAKAMSAEEFLRGTPVKAGTRPG
jgi:methionyl-tRNA formyltransferase